MTSEEPAGLRPPKIVVGVAEAAVILDMRRSNVAKFLEKRGVSPYAKRAAGRLWLRSDVERAKRDYDADADKRDADARRRAAARGDTSTPTTRKERVVLGRTQRRALALLADGPLRGSDEALRMALMRLADRGLVAVRQGRPRVYELTDEGRTALELLRGEG